MTLLYIYINVFNSLFAIIQIILGGVWGVDSLGGKEPKEGEAKSPK